MFLTFNRQPEELAMTNLIELMKKLGRRPFHQEAMTALSRQDLTALIHEHSSPEAALDEACRLLYGLPCRRYPTEVVTTFQEGGALPRRVFKERRKQLAGGYVWRQRRLQELGVNGFRAGLLAGTEKFALDATEMSDIETRLRRHELWWAETPECYDDSQIKLYG